MALNTDRPRAEEALRRLGDYYAFERRGSSGVQGLTALLPAQNLRHSAHQVGGGMAVGIHLSPFHRLGGPLDLILFLLSKNKIEIQDIPIALILEQYLAYLERRQQMDLEVASEFITMAAQRRWNISRAFPATG